jgi:hypothetical protein
MRWSLSFAAPQPPALSDLHRVLSALAGGVPVKSTDSAWSGNPRDGYGRSRYVAVRSPEGALLLEGSFVQEEQTESDDRFPGHERIHFSLTTPDAKSALAAWSSLAAALAPLGYADTTYENRTRPIVDALEEAGLVDEARSIRREATAALSKRAPAFAHVALSQTSPDDLDLVLESYDRPEAKAHVSLCGLGLGTLPRPLARFRGTRSLMLDDNPLEDGALRGLDLPNLDTLSLVRTGLTRLTRGDLAGMPSLLTLSCHGSQLAHIDPGLREACPRLVSISVADTPLSRDPATLRSLREAMSPLRLDT